ncbi:MAG: succinoglycan biosynthesis transport protein ExoP, partial [Gammaproteobacteria bacterium]
KLSGPQADKETLDFPIARVVPFEALTNTVAEVIRSRTIAEEVVRRLGLDKPSVETVWWKIWKTRIKGYVSDAMNYLKYGRVKPTDPFSDATTLISKFISVEPTKDTYVFEIKFLGKFPELAAAVVNTATEVFIEYNLEMSKKESSAARGFVEAQVRQTEAALAAARAAVKSYKLAHAIVELDKEVETQVNAAAELRLDLAKVQRDEASASARVTELKKQLGIGEADGQDSKRRRLAGALREDLLSQLVRAETDRQSHRAASSELKATIRQRQAQLELLPEQQFVLSRLKLNLNVAEEIYRLVRTAFDEARIRESKQIQEIRVISRAKVSTYPVRPIKMYYAGLAMALALIVGFVVALLLEYLNVTLESTDSTQDALNLPPLATFPRVGA